MNRPTIEEVMTNLNLNKDLQFVKDNLLYLVVSGSRAYGTSRPESDWDIRGVTIPDISYFLTTKKFEQHEDKTNDITIYSLTKFIELAKNCNPNIVELLFVHPEDVIYSHPAMNYLLKHRDLFISKRAEHTFLGYSHSQLQRIKGHKLWLDNPLTKPERKDYDLDPVPKFTIEKLTALNTLGKEDYELLKMDTTIKTYVQMELAYRTAHDEWKRYDNWVKNRNPARAELEAKMGYDVKMAMHLIRLMNIAEEIATTGIMHTRRPDADFLNYIRNGGLSYDELLELADEKEVSVKALFAKSTLRYSVDHVAINNLMLDILKFWFKINVNKMSRPW